MSAGIRLDVENSTIKNRLCISCGICGFVCPVKAISYKCNKFKEIIPVINKEKCIKCGVCYKYCPHTKEKMQDEAIKVSDCKVPEKRGLNEDYHYYLAYNPNNEERIKSASGGIITRLALSLLHDKKIDGFVHAQRLYAKKGELHFTGAISMSEAEILDRASSMYAPVYFGDVLEKLDEGKTYLFTGTPCVIRGIKYLFENSKKCKNIKIITIALICSHNVNEQYSDWLADKNKIKNTAYKINFRNKDNILDINNFNIHIWSKSGDLLKKDRNSAGFTESWRNYYFAMNCCLYCSDIWGYCGDISVKDAWDKYADDAFGKSLVVIRNNKLNDYFKTLPFRFETINSYDILHNEMPSAIFKQKESYNKNFLSIFSKQNRKNLLLKRKFISMFSKWLYEKFGYKITRNILKIFTPKEKKKIQKNNFNSKKLITVVGGYGYGNTGDEAQCNETLRILRERYPDYQILNLTPTPNYSFSQHKNYYHDFASRVLFFNQGNSKNCFDFDNSIKKKIRFLFYSFLILINVRNVKKDRTVWFINAKKAKMLEALKESSLVFFCGGGYLTGATLSRFWDGMLLCKVCSAFKVPVVMSGQTIGVWDSKFNKWLAKKCLKNVKVITLRDDKQSIKDLEEVGISGSNIFSTHDDALFCEMSKKRQVAYETYICINFHYWGMNEEDKSIIINKIKNIVNLLLRDSKMHLVFIPMHNSDKKSFDDYIVKYPSPRFTCFNYDYDFRKIRRVIADSQLCVTMKHHPIIFAMGENVPVISISFSEYYVHKNSGALEQYGQEACSVNLDDKDWFQKFKIILNNINNNKETIVKEIEIHKKKLKEEKTRFLKEVDSILKKDE